MQHNDSWSWTRRTFMKSSITGALLFASKLLDPPAVRSEAIRNCEEASEREALQKTRHSRHVCHGKKRAPRGDHDSGANYVPAAYPPMLRELASSSEADTNLVTAFSFWPRSDDGCEGPACHRCDDGLVQRLALRRRCSLGQGHPYAHRGVHSNFARQVAISV